MRKGTEVYHGTGAKEIDLIRTYGFDIEKAGMRDPGDFGLGLYFTKSKSRARSYGQVVRVTLNGDFAHIPRPYFLDKFKPIEPTTPEEKLFYDLAFDNAGEMLTVRHSKHRFEIAKRIRDVFLACGYDGIIADHPPDVVVFNVEAIRGVEILDEE